LVGWFAMGGDGQTVWIMTERLFWIWRKIFGRIVSRSKLRLFWGGWHHNIFGWCGKTVLNLAGTGTTKFLGGLFRGVNSYYFGGLAPQYIWLVGSWWVVTERLFWIMRELALHNFRADCF